MVTPVALELHVSPSSANADGNGSVNRPFRTLTKARDACRRRKLQQGCIIWLHEGIYRLHSSFVLGREDGGRPHARIEYRSVAGAHVVISGGVALGQPNRAEVTGETQLWEWSVETELSNVDCRQRRRGHGLWTPPPPPELLLGEEPQRLSTYPKEGKLGIQQAERGGDDSWHLQLDPKEAALCRHLSGEPDMWATGVFGQDWQWASYSACVLNGMGSAMHVALSEVSVDKVLNRPTNRFMLENVRSELKLPGEYFLDAKQRCLLLVRPAEEPAPADAQLSVLSDALVNIEGAAHVSFVGVTFELGRGYGVRCVGSEGVRFEGCEFRHLGLGALSLDGVDLCVHACHVHRVGSTAIVLKGGDPEKLTPAHNQLIDCHIHHWGHWGQVYCPAVRIEGVGQSVIGCHFHHFPHMAVEIRGNNHLIEACDFNDGPLNFADMGAIYANLGKKPQERGTEIRRCVFRRVGRKQPKTTAIYPDNGTMGLTIRECLFMECGDDKFGAIFCNGTSHTHVLDCAFFDCPHALVQSYFLATWNKGCQSVYQEKWRDAAQKYAGSNTPHARQYPMLCSLLEEDRVVPSTCTFQRNTLLGWVGTAVLERPPQEVPKVWEYGTRRMTIDELLRCGELALEAQQGRSGLALLPEMETLLRSPAMLILSGGSDFTSRFLGRYCLSALTINDQLTWVNERDSSERDNSLCLAFDGGIWRVVRKADIGKGWGILQLHDSCRPDRSNRVWRAWNGSDKRLEEQPGLKCELAE